MYIYIYICTHTITININITITIRPTGGVCILRMVGIAESGGGGGVDGHDCFWLGADLRDSGSGCVCVCVYLSLSLSIVLYCIVLYCILYIVYCTCPWRSPIPCRAAQRSYPAPEAVQPYVM